LESTEESPSQLNTDEKKINLNEKKNLLVDITDDNDNASASEEKPPSTITTNVDSGIDNTTLQKL
jgi:hypothetical protein